MAPPPPEGNSNDVEDGAIAKASETSQGLDESTPTDADAKAATKVNVVEQGASAKAGESSQEMVVEQGASAKAGGSSQEMDVEQGASAKAGGSSQEIDQSTDQSTLPGENRDQTATTRSTQSNQDVSDDVSGDVSGQDGSSGENTGSNSMVSTALAIGGCLLLIGGVVVVVKNKRAAAHRRLHLALDRGRDSDGEDMDDWNIDAAGQLLMGDEEQESGLSDPGMTDHQLESDLESGIDA